MAAPSGTVWGTTVVNTDTRQGRIGIYYSLNNTATTTYVTIQVWFWSKYSISDVSNTLYFNNNASSATTSRGSVSINTTSDSGGWSTTNQVLIASYPSYYSFTRGTVDQKIYCSAKLSGVERVGNAMTVSTYYTIPALSKYTITYNVAGDTNFVSATTGYHGQNTTLNNSHPYKDGHTFIGWDTSSSATTAVYAPGGTIVLTSNVTLYAVWEESVYKITYNANGGYNAPPVQTKQPGETITISSVVPIRNGYTFLGWGFINRYPMEVTYHSGDTYSEDSNIELAAVWQPWEHSVAFNANGGTGVPSGFKKYGDTPVVLSTLVPTYGKNVFKAWSTSSDANNENATLFRPGEKYNIIQNGGTVTLYALWNDADIVIHDSGEVECIELVEDSNYGFYDDGSLHCKEFIEGDLDGFQKTYIGFVAFIEK